MNERERVKKTNAGFAVLYITIPVVIFIAVIFIAISFFTNGMAVLSTIVGVFIFDFVWFMLGYRIFFNKTKRELYARLDGEGFVRSYTFSGRSIVLLVDGVHCRFALLFRWNPFRSYVLSGDRITSTWVNDGRRGKGFMEGSNVVSFGLMVDDVKINIPTFISNQRFSMKSSEILTGISKADMAVEMLEGIRKQVQ